MANEELNKRVYVRQIKEHLSLEQLTGNEDSLNRWAIAPDINRPGLELSGYLE
ncbi:MAG: HPr(Ser) kinase/phosphatase, partial [Erysipelotrichaceae bacterium]|nr:HPr(Ser) kinase/phosphatase [Erysipelotrichaceae bacterium]